MAFPTATTSQSDAASGESTINDLLSVGLDTPETEVQDVGDTPVSEPETEVEEEPGTEPEVEEATEEGAEDAPESEGEEEESGEDEFAADQLETDFSDATYAKAAAHWDKRGVKLDPNDAGHRAMLKDWLERGQKISELQSREAEPEEEEAEEPATREAPQASKTPEEQLQDRITGVRAYAKETYNPVVAKEIVMPMAQAFANFFWGKEKAANVFANRSDSEIAEFTQAVSAAMAIQIADAVPQIVAATPRAVEAQFPYMSKMHDMAEKEAAVDEILDALGPDGNPAFPGFDRLVESGAINKAIASPELKEAVFNRDPYKNRVAILKMAYKIARNERVDPQLLTKASQRGRAAERERQQRVAAGRTSPGSSSRGTSATRSTLLGQLVGGGESRSAQLFKNVGRRSQE